MMEVLYLEYPKHFFTLLLLQAYLHLPPRLHGHAIGMQYQEDPGYAVGKLGLRSQKIGTRRDEG